jgi:phasin family protein
MANPRQAERDVSHAERDVSQAQREVSQAAQETSRKIAEETSRAARTAADAGAGAARAGADMLQRNAETVQHAWESGSKMATELAGKSVERFARACGISGEGAQQATEQSARNFESIVQSGTILAGGMQSISLELLNFARNRLEQNMHRVESLVNCRTPQEVLAVQSDLVRDSLEDFVQSTRHIAEISSKMAEEAVRRMNNSSLAPR